jgi:RNA polymerase sigma-70 factor (ECF subfamily)
MSALVGSGHSSSTNLDATQFLLARARGGDQAASAKLFARYEAMLRVLVSVKLSGAIRRRVDTMDVVQDGFMAAWEQIRRFEYRDEGSFRAWLLAIVTNHVRELYRVHGAESRDLGREIPVAPDSPLLLSIRDSSRDSDPPLVIQQKLDAMLAMTRLDEQDQMLVCMRLFEGLSFAAIGDYLGVSRELASKRYRDAVVRMSKFDRGDPDASATAPDEPLGT